MISGIINVYKEKGFTSHDVVAKLRGILRQKKIGHTGTLDPDAEGVLPVCLGAGTRLCDMLTDQSKTYRAVLLLGRTTDTQDTSGRTLKESPVSASEEEVRSCILSFKGSYEQTPPMYSALKVNGKKLYELAREGKEVERTPRHVEITELVIEKIELPEAVITVSCSKGTYIRTLCHDIGNRLGCGGCMKQLTRTRAGGFRIEDSVTLKEIEGLRDEGRIDEILHPVDEMFPEAPAMRVLPGYERLLKNGNALNRSWMEPSGGGETFPRIRLYDTAGCFCALYQWNKEKRCYTPEKMFPESGRE